VATALAYRAGLVMVHRPDELAGEVTSRRWTGPLQTHMRPLRPAQSGSQSWDRSPHESSPLSESGALRSDPI